MLLMLTKKLKWLQIKVLREAERLMTGPPIIVKRTKLR
jgi:hypothetical protein